jgi:hypothetical protein
VEAAREESYRASFRCSRVIGNAVQRWMKRESWREVGLLEEAELKPSPKATYELSPFGSLS